MEETGFSATTETLAHMESMGLRLAFAYHCNRCDYLWYPKDLDVIGQDKKMKDIFNLPAPKACARCKSEYWNKPRRRKLKPFTNPANPAQTYPRVAIPRIKAADRNLKRLTAQLKQIIPNFDEEFQKRMKAKYPEQITPAPVIKIQNRKKRKLKL
jgi:hypothetical protein